MTTRRINYSPDYKSQVQSAMDEGRKIAESVIAANRAAAERERLEREVIEAAKARRCAQDAMFRQGTEEGCRHYEASDWTYEAALSALIDFESKQQQIKK